jgi:hypothetical protein
MAQSLVNAAPQTIPSGGEGLSLWGGAWAQLRVWWRWGVMAAFVGLGLFLGALGVADLGRRGKRPVTWLLLAMGCVAGVFWAISMVTLYFARYMLFLLPVAAIGCAHFLAAVWRRGPAGRVLATGILGYTCAVTLAFWINLCLFGLRPPFAL